jgi:hypothetical protein
MSYTATNPQPANLQTGETCVTLDSGQLVAVLLSATPVDNNAGMVFSAQARAINPDGSTVMHGSVQMVTAGNHMSSHDEVTSLTSAAIGKGMVLAVLGEPLQTTTVDSGGVSVTQTIPPLGASALTSWSIRTMLAASTGAAGVSAASIIG